ncbi:MAG: amidohydrolase [Bacteroidetes bacterium]|nr:MAG: amidohydrolase [Bacteroidota bacterium]
MKIDMHTHIIPEHLPRWADKFGYGDFIHLEHHKPGAARMMKGNEFFREIQANCWDPELRIEEYAQHGTQVQVVCTIPVMFSYWAKPKDGLEVSRFLNDHIAQLVSDYPKNYIGLGTIPMQDTDLAIRELERCKEIGLVGVQIGSNINDKNLSEPEFFPIFEAMQELDMALFVHPWNMMGFHSMRKYWLPWLVGMPAETSRAICSMIFGGVFERLPHLRANFAHAGGSFLPTIGRIEHGFRCRPDLVAVDNDVPPSAYLGRFWVDCITHDIRMLKYVLETAGTNRVTLGSDYPFPLGDLTIGAFIEESDLPQETKQAIFADNTLEWLNLRKEDFLPEG